WGSDTAYLLLYVYDIILTASSTAFLQSIFATLHAEFSMTDLGPLNYFLGISMTRNTSGMFLSQQKYASELLERAGMLTCNPCRTPVDTDSKLSTNGDPVSDPTLYHSLAGALQYLTFTRPDISYAVQQAGCPTTRRSTSGYCVFLGNNLLSWSSKRQVTLSHSSAEPEYQGVANAVAETCWLCNLLRELHTPLSTATLVYCDNVSVVYLSSNPVQHQRTKHIEIDIHFVRDLVAVGHIRVLHVPSRYQFADIFTNGLPTVLFDEFRSSLSVRSSPAQTAGGFEYERLVLEDKRWVGYKDKLAAFEAKCEGLEKDGAKLGEVEIKLREKIPAYCVTNQREYDDLGNELKNAVFSFPTEANSNPSAPLEALPCKKPMEYGDVGLSYSHVTTWS
ncbi:ribonuclease H-like domain-containing protein, partial [Tanacetum coccineum]